MAPESPGNLVTLDLRWNGQKLESQVERYDPTQGNEFLHVSWNALDCPKHYIPIGGGVAYVWVPPDSPGYSHREYRARVDAIKHGFEWIDTAFGVGLMLVLTFPTDYIYVFPPDEEPGPRPVRFKSTDTNRLACYFWLSGDERRNAVVSWYMRSAPGIDVDAQCRLLNELARHTKSGANPVHIDLELSSSNTPSDEPPKIAEPPPWHTNIFW